MTQKKKRNWLLPVAGVVVIIAAILAGALVWTMLSQQSYLIPNLETDHSNIAARGIVTATYPTYTTYGLGTPNRQPYHVFEAVIAVNLTEILWTADDVNSSLSYWKNPPWISPPFPDISLAYDASDVRALAVGQTVEFCGYYVGYTDTVNSFLVTISPTVSQSYLEPGDWSLPDSAMPSPHWT